MLSSRTVSYTNCSIFPFFSVHRFLFSLVTYFSASEFCIFVCWKSCHLLLWNENFIDLNIINSKNAIEMVAAEGSRTWLRETLRETTDDSFSHLSWAAAMMLVTPTCIRHSWYGYCRIHLTWMNLERIQTFYTTYSLPHENQLPISFLVSKNLDKISLILFCKKKLQ